MIWIWGLIGIMAFVNAGVWQARGNEMAAVAFLLAGAGWGMAALERLSRRRHW